MKTGKVAIEAKGELPLMRAFDVRFEMSAERVSAPAAQRQKRDVVARAQKQVARCFFDRFDFFGLEFNVLLGVVARVNEQRKFQSHKWKCSRGVVGVSSQE